jgi:hypothetical protein
MASKDRYVTGQGMFGGIKGTYGRYGVSKNVSNLSSPQFDGMQNIEEQQMRRYRRRYEPGYSGAGFWFWNYPNMTGAIGAGSMLPVRDDSEQHYGMSDGDAANPGSGLGQGGTAASASGAAGGSPA